MFAELMAAVTFSVAPAVAPAVVEWTPPPTAAKYGTVAIPAIDIRAPIRQLPPRGSGKRVLDQAVGHLPSTYSPGMGGNIVLFGHNVTSMYGRPHGVFNEIDELKRGARITIRMPYGRYIYRVVGHSKVRANAWKAFEPTLEDERVFLVMCWPDGSAKFRYVVEAQREDRDYYQPSEMDYYLAMRFLSPDRLGN